MIPTHHFHQNVTKLFQTFLLLYLPHPFPFFLIPSPSSSSLPQWSWNPLWVGSTESAIVTNDLWSTYTVDQMPKTYSPESTFEEGYPYPSADKQQEDIFPKCRIIYILSDWAIGIQVLTSFKMLLPDNGKTVYRHCNLCYRRKTVGWYTSQEFQVIYNTSRRLNTLLLSGHKTSEKLHPFSGPAPLFGVLMPRIYGLFL